MAGDARGVEAAEIGRGQLPRHRLHVPELDEDAGLPVQHGLERAPGREGDDRPARRLSLDRGDPELLDVRQQQRLRVGVEIGQADVVDTT